MKGAMTMSKRTIIIDTDNKLVELLQDGYNIIERTIYDDETVQEAVKLLSKILNENN